MTAAQPGVAPRRVSPLDGHHLFGFHDVSPWNADFSAMLALEVDEISHPPLPNRPAKVGLIDPSAGSFHEVDTTIGWNFPQGARQLWLPDRLRYAYNRPAEGHPASRLRNPQSEITHELPWGVAAVSPTSDVLYSIDFGRVHRAGGYGHTGVAEWGTRSGVHRANGLARYDLATSRCETLVSLNDCRAVVGTGARGDLDNLLDYVTHVLPSPSGRRLAFLYRSWLGDGGLDTAVCVVNDDGTGLTMLARGNFSHFDWKDDGAIVIWGPKSDLLASIRGRGGRRRGLFTLFKRVAKDVVRPFIPRRGALASCFLVLPVDGSPRTPFHDDVLVEDGHPSFCPADRTWMLCDTYPDRHGQRELFVLRCMEGCKLAIGTFAEPKATPAMEAVSEATAGVDAMVVRITGAKRYMFTRSGLHCDLHPRWRLDGRQVSFDSRHEGSRQIYVADIESVCSVRQL